MTTKQTTANRITENEDTARVLLDFEAAKRAVLLCLDIAALNALAEKYGDVAATAKVSEDRRNAIALHHLAVRRMGALLVQVPSAARSYAAELAGIPDKRFRLALALARRTHLTKEKT